MSPKRRIYLAPPHKDKHNKNNKIKQQGEKMRKRMIFVAATVLRILVMLQQQQKQFRVFSFQIKFIISLACLCRSGIDRPWTLRSCCWI